MGLLLSVLVTCVGVIELITFCQNVRRRLTYQPVYTDLNQISDGYIRELSDIRQRIYDELQKLQSETEKTDAQQPANFMPTFRLNSHENIEIEYDENLTKSRSPSPRKYLVTEKERQLPRRFIVTEEPTIKKCKSQSSIPEFLISEEKNSSISSNKPRYLLQEQPGNSLNWPAPLPRQFIVTENELNAVVFENSNSFDHEEYYKRSPSPYPPLELPQVPRNSICSELVVVDEEQNPKSGSPSPTYNNFDSRILEINNEAALYRVKANNNQILEQNDERNPNLSKVEKELQEALEDTPSFDQDYLNNLDGINKNKIKKNNPKKFIRRKNTGSLDSASTSKDSEDDSTTSILKDGAYELTKTTSRTSEIQPEPFWVKKF